MLCTFLIVFGVVAVFGRPSRGSSLSDMRPCLNSASHFLMVEIEGATRQLWMNFLRGQTVQNKEFYDCTIFKFIHFNEDMYYKDSFTQTT
jgi:hypothetical protein